MPTYHEIVNSRTGEVLARRGRLADSFKTRSAGLLGDASLDPEEALIIKPCWSIHTFFMRFAIDVLFLDKQGKVRKIVHSMPAWRMACAWGARDTVEMSPGVLRNFDVKVGDKIEITPGSETAPDAGSRLKMGD
jgi:uncharacterized membrane protein (UPF0127 family)